MRGVPPLEERVTGKPSRLFPRIPLAESEGIHFLRRHEMSSLFLDLQPEKTYSCSDIAVLALSKGLLNDVGLPAHRSVVFLANSLSRLLPPHSITTGPFGTTEPILLPQFVASGQEWNQLLTQSLEEQETTSM